MSADAAVAAPRLHQQWTPSALVLEPALAAAAREPMQRLGHRVAEMRDLGAVSLVLRRPGGAIEGAADPRKGGEAEGW
jgi:gamma-glutamyltranspeptidase / glutathione hydrolase